MLTKACLLASITASLCGFAMLVPLSVGASDDAEFDSAVASTDRNHHWFTVTPDPRLCPSPLCGGYWITRVNHPLTECVDGALAARCYVATIDLAPAALSKEQEAAVRRAAGHLLLRGTIQPTQSAPFGNLGVLRTHEAWVGHAKIVPAGTFYRAHDTSIVCFAYPCPIVRIAPLNRWGPMRTIAGIDLGAVDADPGDGYVELKAAQGLMVAGTLMPVSGPAGKSFELEATEYYIPVISALDQCDATGAATCMEDEFCSYAETGDCGRGEQTGVCEPQPQACVTIYDPVCGCDGITYSNSCAAHAAGVSVDYRGMCGGKPR